MTTEENQRALAWFTDAQLVACQALVGRPHVWVTGAEIATEMDRRGRMHQRVAEPTR